MTETAGHCLCGAVTYKYEGAENWRGHCHCESCRRCTSSPFTTFFGVPKSAFAFTGEAPKTFVSSPGVRRLFCGTCGSPIAYDSDSYTGEIHLYAASLENPIDFTPTFHTHSDEMLPWIHLDDGLLRK